MKKSVKLFIAIPVVIILILTLTLGFFTVTAYNPENITPAYQINRPDNSIEEKPGDLNIISWNLGYGGLDENTDFFMEGGEMSHPVSREAVASALKEIISFLSDRESDIYFIQEADRDSARTWRRDQVSEISGNFSGYYAWYAPNYRSIYVPYPLSKPFGRMDSGIMTLSRYDSTETSRYQLPGSLSWPVRLFHLRRCALFTKIPSAVKGKDWCLFNIHLSAYAGGTIRQSQLDFVKKKAAELYNDGHFVVIGGDWNTLFPGVSMDYFAPYSTPKEALAWLKPLPKDWPMDDWQWCYDERLPTARSLERPYRRGENFETIIDGFYVSPNVEVREVRGFDLLYKYSDHNPVSVTLRIRE